MFVTCLVSFTHIIVYVSNSLWIQFESHFLRALTPTYVIYLFLCWCHKFACFFILFIFENIFEIELNVLIIWFVILRRLCSTSNTMGSNNAWNWNASTAEWSAKFWFPTTRCEPFWWNWPESRLWLPNGKRTMAPHATGTLI